jgi:hypothetical protein
MMEKRPSHSSLSMIEVIRKPLITKNTSTPTYPPPNRLNPAWNSMTGSTARARRPSISGRWAIPPGGDASGLSTASLGSEECAPIEERSML